jgi:hypothetical protein
LRDKTSPFLKMSLMRGEYREDELVCQ